MVCHDSVDAVFPANRDVLLQVINIHGQTDVGKSKTYGVFIEIRIDDIEAGRLRRLDEMKLPTAAADDQNLLLFHSVPRTPRSADR